jgi:hypothetical protein
MGRRSYLAFLLPCHPSPFNQLSSDTLLRENRPKGYRCVTQGSLDLRSSAAISTATTTLMRAQSEALIAHRPPLALSSPAIHPARSFSLAYQAYIGDMAAASGKPDQNAFGPDQGDITK